MKIAVTSDLHCDVTPQNGKLVPYLVEEVARLAPDALVLAGDIGNTLAAWGEALRQFQTLNLLKLVVPGNHDVWIESKSALRRRQDSGWKHDVALRGIAAEHGFRYLPGSPLVAAEIGFTGSLGWYDYSLRDPRLDGIIGTREYEQGTYRGSDGRTVGWNDTWKAGWLRNPNSADWRQRQSRLTAGEVFDRLAATLEQDLVQVAERATKIVAVVHTNPFRGCISPKDKPDFFDAYEGSTRLGELLARFTREHEILCICGHRHQPLDIIEAGVRMIRSPVGYLEDFQGDYAAKAAEVIREVNI